MRKLVVILVSLLAAALLWDAAGAAETVRRGIELCLASVIPALFPFFVVSSLLVSLGAGRAACILERPFRALFRCGGAGAAAFLLGMLGGYPVGAATVASLVRQGDVSPAEGRRLLAFCSNAGPSFIIGVAGLTVFGSARTGAYLYLIHITAAMAAGFLLRGRRAVTGGTYHPPARPGLISAFLSAVQGAASAMGRVCAFVVFFLVLLSLTERVTGPLPPGAAGFLEVTNGVLRLSPTRAGFITAAALLGWGGLSVHCQTASVLDGTNVPLDRYFLGKALQSLLSALLAAAVWHVIPPAA